MFDWKIGYVAIDFALSLMKEIAKYFTPWAIGCRTVIRNIFKIFTS